MLLYNFFKRVLYQMNLYVEMHKDINLYRMCR